MLPFVRAEKPQFVLAKRAAEGATELLIGERSDRRDRVRGRQVGQFDDRIPRIKRVVAEVSEDRAVNVVGASLGLHIDGNSGRSSDGCVKAVSDDLELADRVGREARLAEACICSILRYLQSIEADLELA